ncbi:uncharacterized [Tachysurus ichikawai]
MTNHMDAAYVFQSMWAQGEQFQENQRQLKKLEAFLDQLMTMLCFFALPSCSMDGIALSHCYNEEVSFSLCLTEDAIADLFFDTRITRSPCFFSDITMPPASLQTLL